MNLERAVMLEISKTRRHGRDVVSPVFPSAPCGKDSVCSVVLR